MLYGSVFTVRRSWNQCKTLRLVQPGRTLSFNMTEVIGSNPISQSNNLISIIMKAREFLCMKGLCSTNIKVRKGSEYDSKNGLEKLLEDYSRSEKEIMMVNFKKELDKVFNNSLR